MTGRLLGSRGFFGTDRLTPLGAAVGWDNANTGAVRSLLEARADSNLPLVESASAAAYVAEHPESPLAATLRRALAAEGAASLEAARRGWR